MKLKSNLQERGHPKNLVQRTLSEVQFGNRKLALLQNPKESKRILPFVTQHHPAVMKDWHLIEQQPLLKEICKDLPASYVTLRGRSIKDMPVRAKLCAREPCRPVTLVPNMIACDNPASPIEWFHFECVGLVDAPSEKRLYTKCAV